MKQYFNINIRKSILIILSVFTLYYAGPMAVAIVTGVLNNEDIAKKLPLSVKQRYELNRNAIDKINRSIDSANNLIMANKANDYVRVINKIRYLEDRKDRLNKQINLHGLNFNRITLIYPVSICLLALTYFIFLSGKNTFSLLNHIKVILPVYIFLISFTWYRNSPWGQQGRTVFSAYNFDINPYIFFYQEFCVFSFVSLIVMIWNKCITEINQIKEIDINNIDSDKIVAKIQEMKRAYYSWQLLSIVLLGVFGFYSFHFWANVFISKDLRYIYQAVIFNMLWIITWVICSIPTILKFEKWNSFKIKILINGIQPAGIDSVSYINLQKYLFEKEIISDLNKSISTIVLILSFLFPLVKAWIE